MGHELIIDASKVQSSKPAEIFSHLPANRIGEAERRYVNEVLDDGIGNTKDPANIHARFETAFAKRFGVAYAIAHNSGSGTMLSALLAGGIGPGDEVIVPPLTAIPTAFVVLQCGGVPVFADIDPDTFCIDPNDIECKITEYTRAMIPVSINGLSPDYDPILALARKFNLFLLEDNAQCFLGTYKGKLVGTLGHAASFSFQASKHMTSGGDGGMTVTDDEELARNIRKHAVQGFRTLSGRVDEAIVPRDVRQDWAFERHDRMGYNFRMSPLQAAVGLAQLERLDYFVAARQYIASQYESVIREERCEWLVPPHVPEDYTHTYYSYCCKLDETKLGVDWRTFRKKFIECGGDGLYGALWPVHLEPIFKTMAFFGARERSPNFDPRYKGKVKSYQAGDCPVFEEMQPRLCQFKTSMRTLEKVNGQVDALRKTIQYYA